MAEITIHHGDTLEIILNYKVNGKSIYKDMCDELEFYFGSICSTLTNGRIVWSDDYDSYMVNITQEESFNLPDIIAYQLRVKMNNKVGGSKLSFLRLDDTISERIL